MVKIVKICTKSGHFILTAQIIHIYYRLCVKFSMVARNCGRMQVPKTASIPSTVCSRVPLVCRPLALRRCPTGARRVRQLRRPMPSSLHQTVLGRRTTALNLIAPTRHHLTSRSRRISDCSNSANHRHLYYTCQVRRTYHQASVGQCTQYFVGQMLR